MSQEMEQESGTNKYAKLEPMFKKAIQNAHRELVDDFVKEKLIQPLSDVFCEIAEGLVIQ